MFVARPGGSDRLGGAGDQPCLEAATTSQNAPSDAGELVGERDRQHIVVQSSFGSLDPGFEPVALPALRLDQDHPGGLNEQRAQVAIAALGYLAQDRAIPRRDLLRDKAQPSGEVAALLRKSFFWPFKYGRTYLAGMSRASWPSALSRRLR